MNIIDLEQGSREWLDYRRTKIGASDFAVIAANAGLCPVNLYDKSLLDLALSKVGKPQELSEETKAILLRGHEEEQKLRDWLVDHSKIDYQPCVIEATNGICMASLDGLNIEANLAVEIKFITNKRKKFDGILDYYLMQLVHQHYVMSSHNVACDISLYVIFEGAKSYHQYELRCEDDLFQLIYFEEDHAIVASEIKLSQDRWLKLCLDFYESYIKTCPTLEKLCTELETVQNEAKVLDDRITSLREQILILAPVGAITESFSINPIYKSETDYQEWSKTLEENDIFVLRESYLKYDYVKFIKDNKLKVDNKFKTKKFSHIKIEKVKYERA